MNHFITGITNTSSARARQTRKLLALATIALLICWSLPNRAQAAAGDLDPTFGLGGKVITTFSTNDKILGLALQPDGKLIAGGVANMPGADFALARYNSDGSLDPSFGLGGKVTTDILNSNNTAQDIIIQPDGKIVAVGSAQIRDGLFALVRYNPDGSLDSSFGSGGKVTTDFGSTEDTANAVALQPDGKIVAAGGTIDFGTGNATFALARYNSDGSLDSAFGSGGKVITDFFGGIDQALSVAIQLDGKIILAGSAFNSATGSDIALARYNPDGSLDSAFGSGGKVITDFPSSGDIVDDVAFGLILQPDGRIIITGVTEPRSSDSDFALVRYNTDGSLDTSFGSGGKVTTDFSGGEDSAQAIVRQPNGRIAVAGIADGINFGLARYNIDGSLDTSFGSGGKATTSLGPLSQAFDLVLQSDGKLIAGGSVIGSLSSGFDFALARFFGDEMPDFDICMQDESNGNLLQFNSTTGEYRFTDCRKGLILTGIGPVRIRFCKVELSASKPDHSITALANICTKQGTASVKLLPSGRMLTISDRDTSNNTCACR